MATLARDLDQGSDLRELAELARDRAAVEVVVGLPRSLSGGEGPAAEAARAYAAQLGALVAPLPVRLVDERLSTVSAWVQPYGGPGCVSARGGGSWTRSRRW